MRSLYRLLLMLLPDWFRGEYAEEMLWIFDQTTGNRLPLVSDLARAVVRQWLESALLWQCVLAVGTAPLPYLFGLQMWKDFNAVLGGRSVSRELGIAEIAIVLTAFLICLFGVAWFRHATAQTLVRLMLNCPPPASRDQGRGNAKRSHFS